MVNQVIKYKKSFHERLYLADVSAKSNYKNIITYVNKQNINNIRIYNDKDKSARRRYTLIDIKLDPKDGRCNVILLYNKCRVLSCYCVDVPVSTILLKKRIEIDSIAVMEMTARVYLKRFK